MVGPKPYNVKEHSTVPPPLACCRLTLHLEFNDSASPLRVPPKFRTSRNAPLALSDLDRGLIDACLSGDQIAWKNFCDRFAGLILDVVNDSISSRNTQAESLVEDFFRSLRNNQFQLLRDFRQKSSLASYLAVAARRHTLLALANQQRSNSHG